MGFSDNQMAVILESANKKAKELERIATEKSFLYMLAIPLNVLVDEWGEEAKDKALQKLQKKLVASLQEIENKERT